MTSTTPPNCSPAPRGERPAGTGRIRTGRAAAGLPAQAGTGRAQVLAGQHDPVGEALLARLAPDPGVVRLLVADLAVDLEYAVVVAEHVPGDRTGERVLGVGVDVHLHHAVVQRFPD